MKRPTAEYLQNFLQELDDVSAFTVEGKDAFMQDVKTQKAVILSYEVIGDIAERLPANLRDTTPHIDWRRWITLRDFLAHNYDLSASQSAWEAVEDVPTLRAAVEALLQSANADDEQR